VQSAPKTSRSSAVHSPHRARVSSLSASDQSSLRVKTSALHDPLTPPLLHEVAPTVLQRTEYPPYPAVPSPAMRIRLLTFSTQSGCAIFDVGIRPEGGDYAASEYIVGGEGGVPAGRPEDHRWWPGPR
jgi:hypothetical protein